MKSLTSFILLLLLILFASCQGNETNSTDANITEEELKESLEKLQEDLIDFKESMGINQSTADEANNLSDEDYEKQFNDDLAKILVEMGVSEQETITKAQFETLFKKVMNKDAAGEEINEETEKVIDGITQKMMASVPEVVYLKNITEYFNTRKMAEIFTDLLSDLGADFDLVGMVDEYDKKKNEGVSNEDIMADIQKDLEQKEKLKEQHNWYKDNKEEKEKVEDL